MEDPVWTWPYWKFGLTRADLSTKLHEQYNTFSSPIQDSEAFHHDVCEISHQANTQEEFHRLMGERKQLRLRELNESLELAMDELVGEPSRISMEHWPFALQFFREKSLDALVRYFSSYLPDWHSSCASMSDTASNPESTATSQTSWDDHDAEHILTDEPLIKPISSLKLKTLDLPLPPNSMTQRSDFSAVFPTDGCRTEFGSTRESFLFVSEHEQYSVPDLDYFSLDGRLHMSDPETPGSSVFDLSGAATPLNLKGLEILDGKCSLSVVERFDDKCTSLAQSDSAAASELTPKLEHGQHAVSFFDGTRRLPHRRVRSKSPSSPHLVPESQQRMHLQPARDPECIGEIKVQRRRRDRSPWRGRRWRSIGTPLPSVRALQPLMDSGSFRSRLRGRKQLGR